MNHFNGLSPEVAELLAILAEECGEVTQRVGKILRHGIRTNPYDMSGPTNLMKLEEELADLQVIANLLGSIGVLNVRRIESLHAPKLRKLSRPDILHHSSILQPHPCDDCGSTERVQRGETPCETIAVCVDRDACMADRNAQTEEERQRISQAILSGDAW